MHDTQVSRLNQASLHTLTATPASDATNKNDVESGNRRKSTAADPVSQRSTTTMLMSDGNTQISNNHHR